MSNPGRLDALNRTGLDAAADPMFDRFAEMVRTVLGVPVALVSLVDRDRQFFPGACGLGDPWAQDRETPLSHSFCQHVVATAAPLVVVDAREDPRVRGNLAIEDLGVVGYAGMPLTDAEGQVLGSLCAIDQSPRQWTERELWALRDLAAACSDSLRLRIANFQTQREFARTRLLLNASQALGGTTTLEEIVVAVRDLVTDALAPAYVGVSLLETGRQVVLASQQFLPSRVAERWLRYSSSERTPSALAASTGSLVLLPSLDAVASETPDALSTFEEMGWQASASVPLPSAGGALGALTLAWATEYELDSSEQAVLVALSGYVTQAVTRASVLDDRRTAAATMQKALLTPLPSHPELTLVARYAPAHHENHVGGDWYDAITLDHGRLALVIGDVVGHSIAAAAQMGQFRTMLRTLIADRRESPSWVLRRLERTAHMLGVGGLSTVLLAYVDPAPDGSYMLTWSNAGHPPPTLVTPDEAAVMLPGTDVLLGVARDRPRRDHYARLPRASSLILHTDGLVEHRRLPVDEGMRLLREFLTARGAEDPEKLADELIENAAAQGQDDVALVLVRTPA
ncbi:GAF domain-containing SpoIIE family protein phosphatase [Cryptosporangium sp. NPDC051539]|uniref:GAF domain-containing SpoIIE family protein phosphatase n=1 Tax=Cryptosporangium sp. NPDC051539 TaxID=3363962 RepID=UPI00378DA8B6